MTEVKPRPRLPEWLRIKLPTSDAFSHTRALLDELSQAERLQTVGQLASGIAHDFGKPLSQYYARFFCLCRCSTIGNSAGYYRFRRLIPSAGTFTKHIHS